MSFKWIFFPPSLPSRRAGKLGRQREPTVPSTDGTRDLTSPESAVCTLASPTVFEAIQTDSKEEIIFFGTIVDRERVEEKKKPNYNSNKNEPSIPGSGDNGGATMRPYLLAPSLSSLAVYGSAALKLVT